MKKRVKYCYWQVMVCLILLLSMVCFAGVVTAESVGAKSIEIVKGTPNPAGVLEELYLITGDFTSNVDFDLSQIDFSTEEKLVPNNITLKIMHFNDIHSNLTYLHNKKGNTHYFSQMVKLVREARTNASENEIVLFVSAGDNHIGYVFDELLGYDSESFVMSASYQIFSKAGVDVDVIGNHELDRGPEILAKAVEKDSQYPSLSANLQGSKFLDQTEVPPAVIGVVKGLKIGFIGLTTPEETFIRTKDDPELSIANPVETLKNILPVVDKYSDVIILVNHLGFNEEDGRHTVEIDDAVIARTAASLTNKPVFIIGGHTHAALNKDGLEERCVVAGVPIFQAGNGGKYLGEIVVDLEKEKTGYISEKIEAKLYAMKKRDDRVKEDDAKYVTLEHDSDYDVDFEQKVIDPILQVLQKKLDEKIAVTEDCIELTTEKTIADRYVGECAIANFMNDVVVERSKNFPSGAVDLAVFNATGVAGGVTLGNEITFKDWFSVMPYADTIVVAELTGEQIREIIESNAKRIVRPEELTGEKPVNLAGFVSRGFLHFSSGIRYTIKLGDSPADCQAINITIDGQPIAELLNKKFKVAFSTYIAGGAEGWNGKPIGGGLTQEIIGFDLRNISKKETGLIYRNEIVAYIRELGSLGRSTGVIQDGRVKIIK